MVQHQVQQQVQQQQQQDHCQNAISRSDPLQGSGRTNIRPQLLWVVARDVEAVWIWRGEWDFPASPPWKPIPCEPGLRLKLSFWNLKSYNQVPRPHRRTSGMSLHPEVTHPWIGKICIFFVNQYIMMHCTLLLICNFTLIWYISSLYLYKDIPASSNSFLASPPSWKYWRQRFSY